MPDIDIVIASLEFLGIRPNVENYASRFLIQKITYLAQVLGMPTNYMFTIHVSGPYSRTLTSDYYGELSRVNSLETDYVLNPEEHVFLEKIRACCSLSENPFLLECMSTAVYLRSQNLAIQDNDLFLALRGLKPHLSEYLTLEGITKAKELLFKPEYLTQEIKSELGLWDRIDDGERTTTE